MRLTAWQISALQSAVVHALPHRKVHHQITTQLIDNLRWNNQPWGWAYLTHTNLAARRGRQHRNTSRDLVRELAELGFINLRQCRGGNPKRDNWKPYTYRVNWGKVKEYIKTNNLRPLGYVIQVAESKIRSAAKWWEERQRYKAEKAAKEEAARLAAAEARRRQAEAEKRQQTEQAAKWQQLTASARYAETMRRLEAAGKSNTPFYADLQAKHRQALYAETHRASVQKS